MGHPSALKVALVTIAVLIGIIGSLAAGILARLGGASMTSAVTRGGVAFGGTVTLTLLIMGGLGVL